MIARVLQRYASACVSVRKCGRNGKNAVTGQRSNQLNYVPNSIFLRHFRLQPDRVSTGARGAFFPASISSEFHYSAPMVGRKNYQKPSADNRGTEHLSML